MKKTKLIACANEAPGGIHPTGRLTRTADADITEGQLLGAGATAGSVAICAAGGAALYVAEDGSKAGDLVPVAALGAATGTVSMIAGGAIAIGAELVTAANGKVIAKTGTGAFQVVGRALTAATADGDVIEVAHQVSETR